MKQVLIEDTCAGRGSCVEVCPEVFEIDGEMAVIKKYADLSLNMKIIEAAETCPVEAIVYDN